VTGQDEKRFAVKPIEPLLTKRCWLLFFCTTSEKKIGFLLIEIFRKLFNTQNDGHQGFDPWWPFLYVRASSKHLKHATFYHQNNARGLLVNISSLPLNAISPTKTFLNIRGSKDFALRPIQVHQMNAVG
jgi:hypothetical protein